MDNAEYEKLKRRIDADYRCQIAAAAAERQKRLESLEVVWKFASADSVAVTDSVACEVILPTQNPVMPTQIETPLFPVQTVTVRVTAPGRDDGRDRIQHGLLMRSVCNVLAGIADGQQFEPVVIERWLREIAPEIAAKASRQTIATCLRRLAETGKIELVTAGSGQRSSVYRKAFRDEEEDDDMND